MRLEMRNTDNLRTQREIESTMRYSSSNQTKTTKIKQEKKKL